MRTRPLFEGITAAALFLFAGVELADAATVREYVMVASLAVLGALTLGNLVTHARRPGPDDPVA